MSNRRRAGLIGIVLAVVALEVVLHLVKEPEGYVEVVNQGVAPMEDLKATCGAHEVRLGRVESGQTVGFLMGARRAGTLLLTFRQKGSALAGGIELADYDPSVLRADGSKLVIEVQEAAYRRYPDDHPQWVDRAWRSFKDWVVTH